MTKPFLYFLFWFSPFAGYTQQLSVKELLMFCGQESETTNDYLVAKGWHFAGGGQAHPTLRAIGSWQFKRAGMGYPDNIVSDVQLTRKSDGKRQVMYATVKKTCYDVLKNQVVISSTKMFSGANDNCLYTRYSANNFESTLDVCEYSGTVGYSVTISR